jgi:hypothetical protein
MNEQRKESRNSCYLRAEIYVSNDTPPIVAEAHDISEHGMRLVVLTTRNLPERFMVSIPRRHMREMVRVKRWGENELGVVIESYGELAMRQTAIKRMR